MEITTALLDARLQKTGSLLLNCMINSKTSSIRGLSDDRNEQVRFYRWIHHPHVTKGRLINTTIKTVSEQCKGRHVLAIQDTTEINFEAHSERVSGLGTVGNGVDAGLFLHPLMIIDAETSQGLGFGAIKTWNRVKKKDPKYYKKPIEEKESYRWIETAEQGKKMLSSASCITFLGDRENDIYEFLDRIPDKKTHLIVRARGTRRLLNDTDLLSHLESTDVQKSFNLKLARTNKRKACRVAVDLKYSKVCLKKPTKVVSKIANNSIELSVIQVKEQGQGKNKIHWCLLTTHDVSSIEDAERIVNWYKERWQIEQLFRTLKTQGIDIESSQLEDGESIHKLVIVALNAAIRIMYLVLSRAGDTEHKTAVMFNEVEIICLEALLTKVEGRTKKQQNPYPPDNLAWASWIIGRLGGWKGYTSSEGPAGPIVMGRGLERFYSILNGFLLFRDTCTA